MKNFRPDILTRPLFLLSLGLLLINDFYLKYEHSSFLTGKISDFAGLFAFPYFFSSFQIKSVKEIYISTFLLFIFWKSPFSYEIIEWFQSIGFGINRVVDYSDLIALFILPFSFKYFKVQITKELKIQRVITIPICIISVFAFLATTLQKEKVNIEIDTKKSFILSMGKSLFINSLTPKIAHNYDTETLKENMQDSLFYLTFYISDYQAQVTVLATIKEIDPGKTFVHLDSILYGELTGRIFQGVEKNDINIFKSLTTQEFENYFETNFLNALKANKTDNLYYEVKEINE